jgi:hypothetical protein
VGAPVLVIAREDLDRLDPFQAFFDGVVILQREIELKEGFLAGRGSMTTHTFNTVLHPSFKLSSAGAAGKGDLYQFTENILEGRISLFGEGVVDEIGKQLGEPDY